MRFGKGRVDLQGFITTGFGLIRPAKIIQGSAEIIMRFGKVWFDLQCSSVAGRSLFQVSQTNVHGSQ